MKTSKIMRVVSSFEHKVHNRRIQVSLYFINLNHQRLDVSMVEIVCVSGVKACSFSGKFGVLCFLETPVLRFAPFALLPFERTVTKL